MDINYPRRVSTSPNISNSQRKRKASTLDWSTKYKSRSPNKMSASATYRRIACSWSPVRSDLIRPIKSLDDMLISSYRASLSHHSYSTQIHNDIKKLATDFVEKETDFRMASEDNSAEMREVNENTPKTTKEDLPMSSNDRTSLFSVHRFYQQKRKIPQKVNVTTFNTAANTFKTPERRPNVMQKCMHQATSFLPSILGVSGFSKSHGGRNRKLPESSKEPIEPGSLSGKSSSKTNTVKEDGFVINTNVKDLSAHKHKMTCVHRSHTPPTQPSYVWHKAKKAMDNVRQNLPERLESLYYAQRLHSPGFSLFSSKCKVKMNWTNVCDFRNKTRYTADFGIYDLRPKCLMTDEEIQPPLKHHVRRRLQRKRICSASEASSSSVWAF